MLRTDKAYNQGRGSLRGEYVVLVRPDTPIEEGFFESLEKLNLEAGAAGPKILVNLRLSARKALSSVLPLDPALHRVLNRLNAMPVVDRT